MKKTWDLSKDTLKLNETKGMKIEGKGKKIFVQLLSSIARTEARIFT